MPRLSTRGAGRQGGQLGLTRPAVMAAALALVDREGAESLSLRRLGADLGVEAMTVHYHAGSKDGLLDGVVEAVLAEVVVPPLVPGEAWIDRVRTFACAYRAALLGHPRALPLVAVRPWQARSPRLMEALLAMLRRGGLGPVSAWRIAQALSAYVIGQALVQSYEMRSTAENASATAESGPPQVSADEFPILAHALATLDPQQLDLGASFSIGLEALLAGLNMLEAED